MTLQDIIDKLNDLNFNNTIHKNILVGTNIFTTLKKELGTSVANRIYGIPFELDNTLEKDQITLES